MDGVSKYFQIKTFIKVTMQMEIPMEKEYING
jgi:hypothetical protein